MSRHSTLLNQAKATCGLGARIRRMRRRLGWTLQEVADRCGCTRSLLSKIETGKVVPPVATLMRIAAALGASASALMEEGSAATTVVTRDGDWSRAAIRSQKGYRFAMLAAGRPDKLMQPILFEARRGEIVSQPMTHAGEELVFVVLGRMKYRVGDVEYTLREGDSVYFDAEQPHELTPLTARVRFLAVFTEVHRNER